MHSQNAALNALNAVPALTDSSQDAFPVSTTSSTQTLTSKSETANTTASEVIQSAATRKRSASTRMASPSGSEIDPISLDTSSHGEAKKTRINLPSANSDKVTGAWRIPIQSVDTTGMHLKPASFGGNLFPVLESESRKLLLREIPCSSVSKMSTATITLNTETSKLVSS